MLWILIFLVFFLIVSWCLAMVPFEIMVISLRETDCAFLDVLGVNCLRETGYFHVAWSLFLTKNEVWHTFKAKCTYLLTKEYSDKVVEKHVEHVPSQIVKREELNITFMNPDNTKIVIDTGKLKQSSSPALVCWLLLVCQSLVHL